MVASAALAGGLRETLTRKMTRAVKPPAAVYPFIGIRRLIAVRGTGAGRAGAGRRQERRPGRGPGRARGAERAVLNQ